MHYTKSYFERTSKLNMTNSYNFFLKHFQGKTILDLGCGSGRDSNYFKQLNYDVCSIDNSVEAKNFANSRYNIDVDLVDIKNGINGMFDGIWSCASLVHMNSHEILKIVQQLKNNLNSDGQIYISLKYGVGKIEKNNQIYYLYDECIIDQIIALGFKLCDVRVSENDDPINSWIEFIVQKTVV